MTYKIWLLTAMVTVLLIHIHYGAFLITIFATPTITLPINNLQELHDKNDEWTFSIEADSMAEREFRVSVNPFCHLGNLFHYFLFDLFSTLEIFPSDLGSFLDAEF